MGMSKLVEKLKAKGYKFKILKSSKDPNWLKLEKKAHDRALKMCKAVEDAHKNATKSNVTFP